MRALFIMLLGLLLACGQKGPLYFAPQAPAADAPAQAEQTSTARDDDDETSPSDSEQE